MEQKVARARNGKNIKITSSEPLTIFGQYSNEFHINGQMPYTKIVQVVLLYWTKWQPELKIEKIFKWHKHLYYFS